MGQKERRFSLREYMFLNWALLLYSVEYNEPMYQIKPLPQFADWLSQLKDPMTRARLVRRLEKAERGLLGDVAPVGEGVSEMREHFGAGWRMYYIQRNGMLIVMLGGGSKATQSADIAKAIALSKTIEE
jgi:putative addiction module killer protein